MYDIKQGLIVSVQRVFSVEHFVAHVVASGAVAVRVHVDDVSLVRGTLGYTFPVIALTKPVHGVITPKEDLRMVCETANFAATSMFRGYENKAFIPELEWGTTIADVSSVDEALRAQDAGCCAVTTAMSGYTASTLCGEFDPPDLDLVEGCTGVLGIPVIAEGRYWTPEDVNEAFKRGAHSVCIGAAITRPDLVTKRFVERIRI